MTVPLGLSLGLSPRESITRFADLARSAEQAGVDRLWVIDSQLAMKDAYVVLAVLARETSSISVGTGVTNVVTRHETVVANAMATLASIAPDRILCGLGSGDSAVFPVGRRPLSIAKTGEAIVHLQKLFRGEKVAAGGSPVSLAFTPPSPPPVYLAASQPRMLRLAGQVADGVIIMGPADPDAVRMQLAHVEAGAHDAGRSLSDVRTDLWVTISIAGEDPVGDVKSWASAQARWLNTWHDVPGSLKRYRSEMVHAADTYDFGEHLSLRASHADVISDEFAKVLAVAGDEAECTARLAELLATGVDQLTVTLLSGGREDRLEKIVKVWHSVTEGTAR